MPLFMRTLYYVLRSEWFTTRRSRQSRDRSNLKDLLKKKSESKSDRNLKRKSSFARSCWRQSDRRLRKLFLKNFQVTIMGKGTALANTDAVVKVDNILTDLFTTLMNSNVELTDEERKTVVQSNDFIEFVEHSSKFVERAMCEKYDFMKDYTLGLDDDT